MPLLSLAHVLKPDHTPPKRNGEIMNRNSERTWLTCFGGTAVFQDGNYVAIQHDSYYRVGDTVDPACITIQLS